MWMSKLAGLRQINENFMMFSNWIWSLSNVWVRRIWLPKLEDYGNKMCIKSLYYGSSSFGWLRDFYFFLYNRIFSMVFIDFILHYYLSMNEQLYCPNDMSKWMMQLLSLMWEHGSHHSLSLSSALLQTITKFLYQKKKKTRPEQNFMIILPVCFLSRNVMLRVQGISR